MNILRRHPIPLRHLIPSPPLSSRPISTYFPIPQPPSLPLPHPLTLSSSTLNSYTTTSPPSPSDLSLANAYFTRAAPRILFSSPSFRTLPPTPYPEVAFLGRSNVGKSSLLNALLSRVHGRDAAHVSKRAGRTRTINGFGIAGGTGREGRDPVGRGKVGDAGNGGKKGGGGVDLGPRSLVLVDMPGYGGAAREEWGVEALKFLKDRRQLRRTFVLVDAEHGVKRTDLRLLALLRGEGVAVQVLVGKVDKLLYPRARPYGERELGERLERLKGLVQGWREEVEGATGERGWLGDVLCFSSRKGLEMEGVKGKGRIGIGDVRWAVMRACGLG